MLELTPTPLRQSGVWHGPIILALWLATMAATLRARLSEEVDADNVQVSQDQT